MCGSNLKDDSNDLICMHFTGTRPVINIKQPFFLLSLGTVDMAGVDSPENQAFRKAYSDLVVAIDQPESLATKLYSQAVIGGDVLDGVFNAQKTQLYKTSILLSAVERHITVNPSMLGVFLATLREESTMKHLADTLFDEYRKCVS